MSYTDTNKAAERLPAIQAMTREQITEALLEAWEKNDNLERWMHEVDLQNIRQTGRAIISSMNAIDIENGRAPTRVAELAQIYEDAFKAQIKDP